MVIFHDIKTETHDLGQRASRTTLTDSVKSSFGFTQALNVEENFKRYMWDPPKQNRDKRSLALEWSDPTF